MDEHPSPLAVYALGLAMAPLIGWTIWARACSTILLTGQPPEGEIIDMQEAKRRLRVWK